MKAGVKPWESKAFPASDEKTKELLDESSIIYREKALEVKKIAHKCVGCQTSMFRTEDNDKAKCISCTNEDDNIKKFNVVYAEQGDRLFHNIFKPLGISYNKDFLIKTAELLNSIPSGKPGTKQLLIDFYRKLVEQSQFNQKFDNFLGEEK